MERKRKNKKFSFANILRFSFVVLIFALSQTSCTEWLEVYPQNDQVSDYYWSSKEDVEAMLNGGYYYYRQMVTTQLLPLGELRAGHMFSRGAYSSLQEFRIKETDRNIANWGPFYEVINVANGVIANADKALANDDTYDENMMNAHKAEARFLRALSYFYLVRNWRDVPLILEPYEDDSQSYHVGQSSEADVIAQIKKDITAALESGAAKEYFNKRWENKGRATRWVLYALMADVCLWSEDYAAAERYCDMLLHSTSPYAPTLLATPSHASWFSIFNPGNSNESIFELQWDEEEKQLNNLPYLFDNSSSSRVYAFSKKMTEMFIDEINYTRQHMVEEVRTLYGGFYCPMPNAYVSAETGYCWKYFGSGVLTEKRTSEHYDPNFIIYRVADVVLMKAEALILQGSSRWPEAVALINQIHNRANLGDVDIDPANTTEFELLECLLNERATEFAGEGKAWYDMLRFGRRDGFKYKESFLLARLLDFNKQASTSWFRSVLSDNNALFLPVWEDELENNPLLIQNPYYK
ncbi:MAG: RagB/SusD family nutrient uptake outer membrane protein [Bacteroidaceae bacterium]|nr:RagB/SusD family nutrient uptake outer membrane protein [Bacteroidaceae bacterium]MBR5963538.1 RagB/SusD family nutrient uptake outer membrane protein [Bacteroidaceae bacterium]